MKRTLLFLALIPALATAGAFWDDAGDKQQFEHMAMLTSKAVMATYKSTGVVDCAGGIYPCYYASAVTGTTTASTSHTVTMPSNKAGDGLVAECHTNGSITSPALNTNAVAWTAISGTNPSTSIGAWQKISSGSEGATGTFTHGTTRSLLGCIVYTIRGSTTLVADASNWGTTSTTSSVAAPSISATASTSLLFYVFDNSVSSTPVPTSVTNSATIGTFYSFPSMLEGFAYKLLSSSGATGATSFVAPTVYGAAQAFSIIFK